MKKTSVVFLFALLFMATFATAQCGFISCLFYGGDFDPNNPNANALANENDAIVGGNPYGAATYQNFIVQPGGSFAHALFTNNLSTLNPSTGYWEIRTGVSEGNGGTLVASGSGVMTHVPTGRSGFGYSEYRDEMDGMNVFLNAGEYWFALVPNDPNDVNRSFNSNTFGLNAMGEDVPNQQFFNSAVLGANFTNANNLGVFPTFSSGVAAEQPEPSTIIMFGSGLVGVACAVRRRLIR